jgi:hypothetical protein
VTKEIYAISRNVSRDVCEIVGIPVIQEPSREYDSEGNMAAYYITYPEMAQAHANFQRLFRAVASVSGLSVGCESLIPYGVFCATVGGCMQAKAEDASLAVLIAVRDYLKAGSDNSKLLGACLKKINWDYT